MKSQNMNSLYLLLGSMATLAFIVLDEEVLVLFCWLVFVILAYNYGHEGVNNFFEKEREKIYKALVQSYNLKEESLKLSINYYIIQVLLISEIKRLFDFSKSEINFVLQKKEASFKFLLGRQIEERLSILADKENRLVSDFQSKINDRLYLNVLTMLKSNSPEIQNLKEKILKDSMSKFEDISKK